MMSLSILPIELLEILFLYLSVDDLVNAWTAVRNAGSDNFWRKVCKQQGFTELTNVQECWKDVFQRNMNWAKKGFAKRTFKLDKCFQYSLGTGISQSPFNILQNNFNSAILGESLLLKSHEENLQLWNMRNEPILMQSLPLNKFKLSKSKLATVNSSVITVYSMVNSVFDNPTSFYIDCANISEHNWCLTDMHVAIFDPKTLFLKIINLRVDFSVHNVLVSTAKVMFFSLSIKGDYLFIFLLEYSQYKIKVFNLKVGEWVEDLFLFQGSAMIGVPKLEISSKYVVSWSHSLENNEITPLKIWSILNGRINLVLSMRSFYNKEELNTVMDISWLMIKGDYILFSTSKNNITVWHSVNPKHCRVMTEIDIGYLTQKTISNALMILLYSYCFKIIDFTKLTCLYEVCFDVSKDTDFSLKSSVLINNLFLIILEEKKDSYETLAKDCCKINEHSQDETTLQESSLQLLPTFKYSYTLSMYDFRA